MHTYSPTYAVLYTARTQFAPALWHVTEVASSDDDGADNDPGTVISEHRTLTSAASYMRRLNANARVR